MDRYILSRCDFTIEYRAGKRIGHCDAWSRGTNPKDCNCPDVDMMAPFKCGPCKKCLKRSETMALDRKVGDQTEDQNRAQFMTRSRMRKMAQRLSR
ncbi:hypothetical protein DPMN_179266 [Dreissena polymorpha]|uniref:Uncharacterized protein n=1 Tax=Dreissena polymorpha TaxID=45954 RepID=A0A9D4EDP2_DREPO|nr:hypothetical protein DPMN_179266 [Dreissena polymorpha]